jgi:diguanylate cyclase
MEVPMTTPDPTKLQATIDALWADIATRDSIIEDLQKTIDELTGELRNRDIDDLTGMYNLRWLRTFWSGLCRPSETIGAVAFLDIDDLKRVNDSHGHKVGDRVITHVASALIASGCYGVRYGGDEFLLLIPAGWNVAGTLNRIVDDIAHPIPIRGDDSITIAVSIGTRMVVDGMDLYQMINDADSAMYQVKRTRPRRTGCRVTA